VPTLEKFSPFRDVDLMERRMRRLFSDFPFPFMPALTPAADIYETDTEFVVELEVAGYQEKELEVEVSDHTLVITGERKEEIETEEKTLRLHERLAASFERRFALPAETDPAKLTAVYNSGLLTLHMPKSEKFKPRKIAIAKK
jgi:HSP20 family protein